MSVRHGYTVGAGGLEQTSAGNFQVPFNPLTGVPSELAPRVNPVSIKDFKAPAGKSSGGRRRGGGRGNEYEREIQQIRERTEALQAETAAQAQVNPLIDDYEFAITKAQAAQELLTAAKRAGIAVTPELKTSIDQLAEGYARATAESNRLSESQSQIRRNVDDMKAFGKDLFSGFISDIRNGTSASEALANALGKVLDKIIDIGLNSIFGTGGSGGGWLGGLFNLFFHANGGVAAHGRPQQMKTFRSGGVSRSAAIFGEAGPEAAVPLPDGRRIPVDLRGPGAMSSGGAETITISLQADPTVIADIANQQIRTASGTIVNVAVAQSNRTAPAAVAKYQQTKAGGDYRSM